MTQEVLTGWNVNVCIGAKNPMKQTIFGGHFLTKGEICINFNCSLKWGDGQFVGNQNVTIFNVEAMRGQE